MTRRAARICTAPGCPTIVQSGARCDQHQIERTQDPEQRKFYNSTQWKKLRGIVRAQEPMCRLCRIRPSTNVDHIDGDWSNNVRENLRALCHVCEPSRTGRQHRGKVHRGG